MTACYHARVLPAVTRLFMSKRGPVALAVLGSALLSCFAIARSPLVNNDGVWYLLSAEAFAARGFPAAQAIHYWPFYSGLIALVATVLPMSFEASAHVVDTALLALATGTFVVLVQELGGSRRTQLLGVAVALSHPGLNRCRAFLIRDFGVWAFALLALVQLLRFGRDGRARAAVTWAAFSTLAVLFRPDEALTLLAGAPVSLLLDPDREWARRVTLSLKLLAVLLLALEVLTVWLFASPAATDAVLRGMGHLVEPLTAGFRAGARGLAESFPLPHGREYAPYILLWGLLPVPIVKTLKASGLVHVALSVFALARMRLLPASAFARRAVWVTTGAAILAPYGLLMKLLFVETRYAILASLLLCLWAPFGVECLLRFEATPGNRFARYGLGAALGATLIFGLISGSPPQTHLTDTIGWLRRNTPPAARLYTNSVQIAYYSGRVVDWNPAAFEQGPVDPAAAGRSDYCAVRLGSNEAQLLKALDRLPELHRVAFFSNADGESVVIYRAGRTAASARRQLGHGGRVAGDE